MVLNGGSAAFDCQFPLRVYIVRVGYGAFFDPDCAVYEVRNGECSGTHSHIAGVPYIRIGRITGLEYASAGERA